MVRFRHDAYYIDTETCGFHGLATLIQWEFEDGPINLHNLWDVPVKDTLSLIEEFTRHTCVFFNASYDWFHLCKIYTTWRLLLPDAIPCELPVEQIAQAEMDGRDGPCLKPKSVMCLMLHSRKGEFQTLMDRHEIRIKKVPSVLAEQLRDELETTILLDDILFAKRADQNAPRWAVLDRVKRGKEDQVDPNFKDVALKFKPARSLKYLARYCLGLDPKYHTFKDVYPERPNKLFDLGFAPFALAHSNAESQWEVWDKHDTSKGFVWPALIHHDIEHWRTDKEARQYASDDILYTRLLDEYFGFPEADDDDSTLACMVAAVRWHGFEIDHDLIRGQLSKANEIYYSSPVNINKPQAVREYIREVMDDSEATLIDKSTKKANLERIKNEYTVEREDCDPEVCSDPCPVCTDGYALGDDIEQLIYRQRCERCEGHCVEPGGEVCVRCLGYGEDGGVPCLRCFGVGFLLMGPTRASKRAGQILKIKAAAKEKELFEKLLLAGRFHAEFKVIGALSSRMSGGGGLNAQGIKQSEEVRGAFPLKWGNMVLCGGDFASFEVTLADAVFGDPRLHADLLAGKSIHTMMATQIYPRKTEAQIVASKGHKDGGDVDMYTNGKRSVFSTFYGGDDNTISVKLSIPRKVAKAAFEGLQKLYPGIKEKRDEIAIQFEALKQHGEVGTGKITYTKPADYVESFLGFRRRFTLENKIAKALFDLARTPPKAWRKLIGMIVRRDREQTAAGAASSALYGAAFQIQAATIRAGNNHLIQSPGATITKRLQRRIWDVQPYGVGEWLVAPMNVHDEVLSVTDPAYVDRVTDVVVEVVESYRDKVPLIGMDWTRSMDNWAGKGTGGLSIGPHGIKDDAYVGPVDLEELEELSEEEYTEINEEWI